MTSGCPAEYRVNHIMPHSHCRTDITAQTRYCLFVRAPGGIPQGTTREERSPSSIRLRLWGETIRLFSEGKAHKSDQSGCVKNPGLGLCRR